MVVVLLQYELYLADLTAYVVHMYNYYYLSTNYYVSVGYNSAVKTVRKKL